MVKHSGLKKAKEKPMITASVESPLKRIAVFYDGAFFFRLTNYYKCSHERKAHLTFSGLHEYIRHRVASFETNNNVALCRIVDPHLFRGRLSLTAAQANNCLETDRHIDQLIMQAGVVAHDYPMNERVDPPRKPASPRGLSWKPMISRSISASTWWRSLPGARIMCH